MRTATPSLMTFLAVALIVPTYAQAEIAWQTNLRSAHSQAQSEGKLLLLHFYSDNCVYCEKLEEGAFQQPEVAEAISQQFVPVKVHANSSPKLAEMFQVTKFPTDVVVTVEGTTLLHSVSPQSAERYVAMLQATAASRSTVAQAATPQLASTEGESAQAAVANVSATEGEVSNATGSPSKSLPGYATQAAPPGSVAANSPDVATTESFDANPDNLVGEPATSPTPPAAGVSAQLASARSPAFEMPTMGMPGQSINGDSSAVSTTDTTLPAVSAGSTPVSASLSDEAAATNQLPVAVPPPSANVASNNPTAATQTELAMQGFCPVTVVREDKWVEGKPEFGVIHLGKLYLFTNQEAMQTFLSDPIPYTPVLNEIDAVVFFEERRIVPGKREWGLKDPIYGRMFFFADEASMNHFYNQYERYTKAAIEVMDKAVKEANPSS